MSEGRLKIQLEKRVDSHGKIFYVGKLKGPVLLDCKDGVAFLVFTSEEDQEELHIADLDHKRRE